MKKQTSRRGFSAKKVLILMAVLLLIVIIYGITYIQNRQQTALIHQAAESQYQTIDSFSQRLDENLVRVESHIYNALYQHKDLSLLNNDTVDEIEHYYAKETIASTLEQIVQLNEFIECVWMYSPAGSEKEFLARNDYTGLTIQELLSMQEFITDSLDNASESVFLQQEIWSLVTLNEKHYLLWMTPVGGAYCGAWVSFPYLFGILEEILPAEHISQLSLCSADGTARFSSGDIEVPLLPPDVDWASYGNDHINICKYSNNADLAIEVLLTKQQVLSGWHMEFDYTWAFTILLGFVLLAFALLQILVYRPFRSILSQMKTIGAGNLQMRVEENSFLTEISLFGHSINQLLDKIKDLNAQIYEAQITQRDIQCQYLQIRLKTHFYMNCLSIIHAMARTGHTDLIQELSDCLVKYLRFVDVDTEKFVRLKNELEHVRNYARIQELRFPGLFEYHEDVSLELYDTSIPPLILQTFIENSVEHGMNRNFKNYVYLESHFMENNGKPGVEFVISDNGKGFSEEDLASFAADPKTFTFNKSHGIGIRNVISRLNLLYNGNAAISFCNNSDGGACIHIWLPFLDMLEEEL